MLYAMSIFDAHPPLSRTASAAATDLIRQAILHGRVAPGQRLKEEDLAQQLGLSRTPIREALLVLQTEGLIDATPNRGATVRIYALEDLEDMYDLRALLEGHAARRAATRMGQDEVAELRASCDRFEQLIDGTDLQALVAENALFHETILAAAQSERLTGMVRQVIAAPLVYKSYIWYSPQQTTASLQYHRELTDVLELADAERAESIMREHVYAAREVLAQHLAAASVIAAGTE